MKKKLFLLVSISVLMLMIVGCGSGATMQTNTPIPNGQITVPGVDIHSPAVSFEIVLPGANSLINNPDARGRIAGVLTGIWHGIISPVTLVVSFVNPNMQMYEVHNDGSPYNFGFLLGVALIFAILGVFAGSRRRR